MKEQVEELAVLPKDENLEELPEGKQLENNGYGQILTPESDALSAQSPNRDIHITKISKTVQGIVTESSVFIAFIFVECDIKLRDYLSVSDGNCKCRGKITYL